MSLCGYSFINSLEIHAGTVSLVTDKKHKFYLNQDSTVTIQLQHISV